MKPRRLALGVDIGGTKTAYALVDSSGRVLAEQRLPTDAHDGAPAVLERTAAGIVRLAQQAEQPLDGIGVGCPGFVNPVTGVCHQAVNLGWRDVPIHDMLAAALPFDLPLYVQRDTCAGTVGEWAFGAGAGESNFVYVAMGTGLGFGAVVDGRLLQGGNYLAMEYGHVSLDPAGRACPCGLRGCAEVYASGVGLLAGFHEHRPAYPGSPLAANPVASVGDIVAAAGQDDPLALALVDEAAGRLAAALACAVGTLDPALFIIGGGLGLALYDLLLPRLERGLRRHIQPVSRTPWRFARSQAISSAAGAAALVWRSLSD